MRRPMHAPPAPRKAAPAAARAPATPPVKRSLDFGPPAKRSLDFN